MRRVGRCWIGFCVFNMSPRTTSADAQLMRTLDWLSGDAVRFARNFQKKLQAADWKLDSFL